MPGYADVEDPVALLNRAPDTSGGPKVEDAIREAGFEVQAVNWVWEKVVGENLVESIIEPITGDFEKISEQAGQWKNVKDSLQAIRNNLNAGLGELQPAWQGEAASGFQNLIGNTWTLGIEADAQAANLIGFALNKVAEGSKRACDEALNLIKMLVDKLIEAAAMLPIPVVGWGRAVKLVYDGIQIYNAIMRLIEGIKAIIEGAQQVIQGVQQVGTAISKIKDINNLNDALNTANEAGEGLANVKGGVDSVRGGLSDVREGATSAASAGASAHDNATGLRDERAAARDQGSSTSGTDGPDGTGTTGRRPDGTQQDGDGTNRPADPNDTRTPENQRNTCGDPVDVATGEVVLGQTDVELAGALPLILRRTHISSYRAGRYFGRSWASTLDQRLELDRDGAVYVADDGMLLVYPDAPATGEVEPLVGPRWPLRRTDTGYAISKPESGQVLHFAAGPGAVRPLTEIADRADHRISFLRNTAGAIAEVVHSGGYHIDVDTTEAGLITGLRLRTSDGQGIALARYRYTEAGELAEVINSSNLPLKFSYDSAGRITQWTDRNGAWYRYLYDERGRCMANQGSGGFLNGTFAYEVLASGASSDDSVGRVTRYTDAMGNITVYRFDSHNNVIAETDPLGHTTTSEWDERDRLITRTDPLGHTTRNTYDETGNLVQVSYPNDSRATVDYDEGGRPVRVVDPDGAVWLRQYDERGRVTAITDPTGAITTASHAANQVIVTDPLGNVTRVMTNAAGLPVAVTDPLGATTQYVRDTLGRVSQIIDPLGGVVRLTWTIEGRLVARTSPDGTVDRWRYDGEGNQVEHVDPLGRTTRTEITHFDLPAARTSADGARLEFGYDTRLLLTSVTNGAGQIWRYEYDAAGNLVRETDFHGRVITYSHDAAGRLAQRTNGAGETVAFTRDALGNAVEKRAGDRRSLFEFDPVGRLMRATNPDADVRYTRDAIGRVLTETSNGRTITSTYDRAGRRIGRTMPSGAQSTWEFDARDRPVTLATAGQTLRFGYDAAGREVQRQLGAAAVLGQAWDVNHRLTGQSITGAGRSVQQRRYHYRPDGLVARIEDLLGGNRQFDLDAAGRVTAVQAANWTERYAYDVAGALVTAPNGPQYQRDPQGRVVRRQHRTLSGQVRSWTYSWDAEDRLVAVTTPNGARWRYRYDALGRRIAKERLDETGTQVAEQVEFTWDGVKLAEQTTTGGVTTWDYEPGNFRPLTQTVDDAFYALVTDIVGTPTEMLDPNGELAWQSQSTLWGAARTRSSTGVNCPLRFPGQYFDEETGQHYNYFRYYDPESGRYQSSDPLGLLAGPDPQGYPSNPLAAADPLGLVPCTLTQTGPNTYQSPGGLVYGPDPSPHFTNRYDHVMNHANDIPNRDQHGVFNSTNGNDVVRMVDDAYARVQSGDAVSIPQGNRTAHFVNMGQPVGYIGGVPGGQAGHPQVNYIQLVTENGNQVITAFPVSGIPSSVLG